MRYIELRREWFMGVFVVKSERRMDLEIVHGKTNMRIDREC